MKKPAPPSPAPALNRAEAAYNLLLAAGVSPAEIGEAAVRLTIGAAVDDRSFVDAMMNLISAAVEVQKDMADAGVNLCECPKCMGNDEATPVMFVSRVQGDES